MARPLRITYAGAFYHVTARGNERKKIFRDDSDRKRFLGYLESAVLRYKAVIHVYCLMGNHYHILMSTPSGNLSQILRHINGAYTVYFNTRHHRAGHLFQGRYKAVVVDADEYAGELSRYIHRNPVRARIVDLPEEYPWSSYAAYTGKTKSSSWLTTDWLLQYFGRRPSDARHAYREFVEAKGGGMEGSPLKEAVASSILGRAAFIDDIREKYLGGRKKDRDVPALGALSRVKPEEIMEKVGVEFQGQAELAKKVGIYLSHRYGGLSLREIGRHFGVGESAVSQASRRFQATLDDRELRRRVDNVRRSLNL